MNRVVLLSLKDSHKDHPLLPLGSDDVEAFKSSALHGAVNPDGDLSEVIAQLMGPGPWTLSKDIPLPKSGNELHFTNKNKKSNIIISHTLKIIFRVQRGDDQEVDPQTGKRKMFDIVVQTPIHILSCLCRPDFTALPPYSESSTTAASLVSSPLCVCGSGPTPHHASGDTTPIDIGLLSPDIPLAPRGGFHRHVSGSNVLTPASLEHAHHTPGPSRPPLPRLESLIERSTHFERLVAGRESEAGEAPPAYDDVVVSHTGSHAGSYTH